MSFPPYNGIKHSTIWHVAEMGEQFEFSLFTFRNKRNNAPVMHILYVHCWPLLVDK